MTSTAMIVRFLHRHVWDTMIILEEGNLYHPCCPQCDILVPWKSFNGQYTTTDQCVKGVERKIFWLAAEEMRESTTRAFQSYDRPLETV